MTFDFPYSVKPFASITPGSFFLAHDGTSLGLFFRLQQTGRQEAIAVTFQSIPRARAVLPCATSAEFFAQVVTAELVNPVVRPSSEIVDLTSEPPTIGSLVFVSDKTLLWAGDLALSNIEIDLATGTYRQAQTPEHFISVRKWQLGILRDQRFETLLSFPLQARTTVTELNL